MGLTELLERLWSQYTKESPEVLEIYNLFKSNGEHVVNDHIAFRTFDLPHIDVISLGKFFEDQGYIARGEYEFKQKKLYARHYESSENPELPKIFISELKVNECSSYIQKIAHECVDKIPRDMFYAQQILYAGSIWGDLDYDVYQKLLSESEYAAWLYVFGFRANHFTVSVNHLKKFNSVQSVNQLLKQNSFKLNEAGGEIKGNSKELLEQSSTKANQVMVKFKQGEFLVLNSYYEFAKRYPQDNGDLYHGFIASSADKIFESTNMS